MKQTCQYPFIGRVGSFSIGNLTQPTWKLSFSPVFECTAWSGGETLPSPGFIESQVKQTNKKQPNNACAYMKLHVCDCAKERRLTAQRWSRALTQLHFETFCGARRYFYVFPSGRKLKATCCCCLTVKAEEDEDEEMAAVEAEAVLAVLLLVLADWGRQWFSLKWYRL